MDSFTFFTMVMCKEEVYALVFIDIGSLSIQQWYWCIACPLIDDLKTLWDVEVEAYDVCNQELFILWNILMWIVRDFPTHDNFLMLLWIIMQAFYEEKAQIHVIWRTPKTLLTWVIAIFFHLSIYFKGKLKSSMVSKTLDPFLDCWIEKKFWRGWLILTILVKKISTWRRGKLIAKIWKNILKRNQYSSSWCI